jgi:hypothetical protein
MTLAETIYQRSLNLPEDAAREALDFIEFLSQRYGGQQTVPRDAAAHDAWFRSEVQRALDDTRPGIPHDEAREYFAARREALRAQTGK